MKPPATPPTPVPRPLPPGAVGGAARGGAGDGRGEAVLALAALAFVLLVSAAWWALALWPAANQAPAWLQTARAVCFGAHDDGLPNAGGWILLMGEPLGMLAALYLVWRAPLEAGLRALAACVAGRSVLAGAAVVVLAGLGAAGWRVAGAVSGPAAQSAAAPDAPLIRRLAGTPAPPLSLVDQHGDTLTLQRFHGRPVLVTFAYAHCATVCPLLVHDALRLQRRVGPTAPVLVVVTLDPWRDTPARLPYIASTWKLGPDAFAVSGGVEKVTAVLQAWGVPHARDLRTGEVTHAPSTFLVDAGGRMRFATTGRYEALVGALASL